IGTILLLVSSLITGRIDILIHTTFSQIDIASLLYLGIFGSALAYYFYYAGIKQIGATRAGVFIALNPITAGILGYFLLNEALSSLTLISGLLILFGIFLVNREK
ncbi:DMT family transporter, partial [Proteus columbae]